MTYLMLGIPSIHIWGSQWHSQSFSTRPACQPSRLSEETACPTELQMSDEKTQPSPSQHENFDRGSELKGKTKKNANSFPVLGQKDKPLLCADHLHASHTQATQTQSSCFRTALVTP